MPVVPQEPATHTDPEWLSVLVAVPSGADPDAWSGVAEGSSLVPGCQVILLSSGQSSPDSSLSAGVSSLVCTGAHLFQLWAAGLRVATGAYLAVVDARCPPAAGWLVAARRAIDDGVPAFFGPVSPDDGGGDDVRVEYTLEYGQFARPVDAHLREVPGNNFVFKRELLDGPALQGGEFHKVFFVARLQAGESAPRYRDDLEVLYRKRYGRQHYLRRRLAHGRTYAATRVLDAGLGPRLLRALTCPALPWLRLARVAAAVHAKPGLRAALWHRPLYAVAAEFAWSLGELQGYLFASPGQVHHLD